MTYRSYKIFDNRLLQEKLQNELDKLESSVKDVNIFQHIFIDILNKHAPLN